MGYKFEEMRFKAFEFMQRANRAEKKLEIIKGMLDQAYDDGEITYSVKFNIEQLIDDLT